MGRNRYILVIGLSILIFLTGCIRHVVRVEGPFKGRVVDAETREPIEGVVVLGVWYLDTWTIAGAVGRFYDAEETVTDEKGEFTMPGKTIRVLTNLGYVYVMIFKAGYSYRGGTKKGFKTGSLKDQFKWEGSRAIIPLRKLTVEEMMKHHDLPEPPGEASLEKVILMLKEIDKDKIERGLEPRGIWRGEKYD